MANPAPTALAVAETMPTGDRIAAELAKPAGLTEEKALIRRAPSSAREYSRSPLLNVKTVDGNHLTSEQKGNLKYLVAKYTRLGPNTRRMYRTPAIYAEFLVHCPYDLEQWLSEYDRRFDAAGGIARRIRPIILD